MKTREEAVKTFFDKVEALYIKDQQDKGIVSSGASARSFRKTYSDILSILYGSGTFHYQKVGRRPGKFPPIEAIIQWIKDKKTFRVDDERGPGIKGLAFLIARKIARSGTDIFQKKRPGLSVEERITELRKELVNNIIDVEKGKIAAANKKRKPKKLAYVNGGIRPA